MKKIIFLVILNALSSLLLIAQKDLFYYLPEGISYNSEIPTPESVLGYQVGEWHVSHDHLVYYMKKLAEASERITLEEYGRTYENRPLLLLTITAKENHNKISEIQSEHVKLSDPKASGNISTDNMPVVVWLGYSVHGNEASGSNASLLVAYHLAAAQGPDIEKLLKETVILIDPSINPDGLNRFASWVNTHKGKNLVTDPANREQNEAWPRGRTNHYWFDVNRDWLLVQHPESRGRIAKFHQWKPNVLTDHHEMGTNSTFFFQPGEPSRNHPLTPDNTVKLTNQIGEYHAKWLNNIGSLYYTKEGYDDFYYGKGSTYPDINGGIGILFEQASSRGHAQESDNGILEFEFAIRNHFTSSLSTLEAALNLRKDLLEHQREFYTSVLEEAKSNSKKEYIFGTEKDKARTGHLVELLLQHQIEIYEPARDVSAGNLSYKKENSFIVPLNQPQYRLIEALFEKRTSFEDSLFYDISAWTIPLAFNVNYAELDKKAFNSNLAGKRVEKSTFPEGKIEGEKSNYAYVFEWNEYYAPRTLNKLLEQGLISKVATKPFTAANGRQFNYGTILIPVAMQKKDPDELYQFLNKIAKEDGITIHTLKTGLSLEGIDLGSGSFEKLNKPRLMMLVDGGVSSYEAGEVWHLLDQRFDMKVSMVPVQNLSRTNLDRYNTIIMVNGNYDDMGKPGQEKLKQWIANGGNIVAVKSASKWLSENKIGNFKFKKIEPDTSKLQMPYGNLKSDKGAQVIGGAIFNTKIDLTHPLAYGYEKPELTVFRNSTLFLEPSKNPYANPVLYTEQPLASGYISKENTELLKKTASVSVGSLGKGKIIALVDNPNFRAFWYGTNKLFLNSIFFGHIISGDSAE